MRLPRIKGDRTQMDASAIAGCDDPADATTAVPPPRRSQDRLPGDRDRTCRSCSCTRSGLSHREWEPIVAPLSSRFRVVLPDLPLHGDSEDRPRHPYSPDWFADVIAGFCREVGGPRCIVAGHDIGAELALLAISTGRLEPSRLVLMPSRLHRRDEQGARRAAWRAACRLAALPGFDRVLAHGAKVVFRPSVGRTALGPAQRGRARPDPPRVCGRRRQRQPRPIVGEVRPALAGRGPAPAARRLPGDAHAGAAAVGRRRSGASARGRRRGARSAPDAHLRTLAAHRLPDRLRRPGRGRARAARLLRLSARRSRRL